MSRLSTFLAGFVVGAVTLFVAMSYHLVRSNEGVELIAKLPARLSESYVDIRAFSISDWTTRPQLAAALVKANRQHLVSESAAKAAQETVQQVLPNWSETQ